MTCYPLIKTVMYEKSAYGTQNGPSEEPQGPMRAKNGSPEFFCLPGAYFKTSSCVNKRGESVSFKHKNSGLRTDPFSKNARYTLSQPGRYTNDDQSEYRGAAPRIVWPECSSQYSKTNDQDDAYNHTQEIIDLPSSPPF